MKKKYIKYTIYLTDKYTGFDFIFFESTSQLETRGMLRKLRRSAAYLPELYIESIK